MSGRLKLMLPFAVVGAGLLGAIALVATRPEPAVQDPERPAPLVRVIEARARSVRLEVRTQGTVQPRTESELVPEVSGPVVWRAPSFVPGGFFDEGEVLVRIDPGDYQVAYERALANFERRESEYARDRKELERRRTLAERDYASPAQLDAALTQERVAAAALREARANRVQAKRDLERTELRAPFTGRVRETSVDVGQFVNRGAPIARLYATDYVEVRLPVSDAELAFLDLPLWYRGEIGGDSGPAVLLRARFAGADHEWRGRVVRTEGEIDPRSRMVHVIARFEDPYARADGRPPLAVGLFVEAFIEGRRVENVFVVPRAALRGGDRVFAVDADDRLRTREVSVVRADRETVVIAAGLAVGDRVVVSPLDAAIDGMSVRPIAGEATP